MSFNAISEDIYLNILSYIIHKDDARMFRWKDALCYLKICQNMRQALLPVVYRHALIGYEKYAWSALKTLTNSELIATGRYVGLVRVVTISVPMIHSPTCSLLSVLEILKLVSMQWSSVHTVDVDFSSHDIAKPASWDTVTVFGKEYQNFIWCIRNIMPNIKTLKTNGTLHSSIIGAIYGNITSHPYWQPDPSNNDKMELCNRQVNGSFDALTHVAIEHSLNDSYWLVLAAAKTLQHIKLGGLKCGDFSLLVDYIDNDKVVEFPELQLLSLQYISGFNSILQRKKTNTILLPKLATLNIKSIEIFCPIMESAVFPDNINHVEIEGPCELVGQFINTNIKTVQAMLLHFIDEWNNNTLIGPTLKNLYAHKQIIDTGKLKIPAPSVIEPKCIQFQTITHMNYKAQVNSEMILALVNVLPKLVVVEFTNIVSGGENEGLDVTVEHDTQSTIKPLNSLIRVLTLKYDYEIIGQYDELFIKHLLLRLPHLHMLNVENIDMKPIKEFISMHKIHYKHLAWLQINED